MELRERYGESTAIVFAEGAFGRTAGKTANGVVKQSELFRVGAVVDSTASGRDAGQVLGAELDSTVPVVESMKEALTTVPDAEVIVLGVAPVGGELPDEWVGAIETAMDAGLDVISGLHEFLSEDPEWRERAAAAGVDLVDVRKPPEELRVADGRVEALDADVVLTMGTDCAVGKRTTAYELYRAAEDAGLDVGWVATGQTGIMTGADAGVVVDRVPADFVAGVVEDLVCKVAETNDLVIVEGQAALSHRAYSGVTLGILHGAFPDAVVLVDDPERERRDDFEQFTVGTIDGEIELVEALAPTDVVAVSTWGDPAAVSNAVGLPVGNVFHDGGALTILDAVKAAL